MKPLSLFLSSLILVACILFDVEAQTTASSIQAERVTSSSYSEFISPSSIYAIQRISADGIWTDVNGEKLGFVESNGILRDAKGSVIGKIVQNKSDIPGYTFIVKGKKTAIIEEDGTVRDMSGTIIYNVAAADINGYCTIYNAYGDVIAQVHERQKHTGVCLLYSKNN